MLPIQSQTPSAFQPQDALLFPGELTAVVQNLLPLPASVDFWFHESTIVDSPFTPEQQQILAVERENSLPWISGSMLIIPLMARQRMKQVDIVIYNVDSALLNKMGDEWLQDLQEKLCRRFAHFREVYIDPVTGLYNQRALDKVMTGATCWKSLFLIATVSRRRTVAGGCQKTAQIASLLEVFIRDPLFYFGQGIFGCISRQCARRTALDFSHRLISRLRREKLHRVHIGFTCLEKEQLPEQTLNDCWQALVTAERRGPYSLCDAASLDATSGHPFALPPVKMLRRLQRKWQGLDSFGLAFFSFAEKKEQELPDLESLLSSGDSTVILSPDQQMVLFANADRKQTRERVEQLTENIIQKIGLAPAVGYTTWPDKTGSGKADCIRNCRKAILHGSFYGSDAVVPFDFLSLNVSGDLYFDEGDYKQAIREYRLGLQMQPDDVNLLNSLGVALAEINSHKQAVLCFTHVLNLQPDNYMALVNKGMSCRLTGQENEAVSCFEQALQYPDNQTGISLELYIQLSRMYCQQGRYEQAIALLIQWQEEQGAPEEFMFFRILGEACMGAGHNKDAVQALQHSLRLHPRNAESLSMLGLLYVLEGEGAEVGLRLCDKAISMDESEPDYWYRRASALFHLGRFSEALPAVRTTLRIRRSYVPAVLLRGRIYEGLGWKNKACISYKRVAAMKNAGKKHKQQAWASLKRHLAL